MTLLLGFDSGEVRERSNLRIRRKKVDSSGDKLGGKMLLTRNLKKQFSDDNFVDEINKKFVKSQR